LPHIYCFSAFFSATEDDLKDDAVDDNGFRVHLSSPGRV